MSDDLRNRITRAQWHAFNKVLHWINEQEVKTIPKKDLYNAVMDMRPDAALAEMGGVPLQGRVSGWMQECFGPEISADRLERGDRLLEEVFELLQSGDYPKERVDALRDYVWSRPKGEPEQEVGGVMLTLAAYCLAHEINMHNAGEREIDRVTQPEVVLKIRAKQAAKPTGSALPIAAIEPALDSAREAARLLLDALNDESELDDVIQTAMQEEADTDGTDEWVFALRAGLRAIAEGKDDD